MREPGRIDDMLLLLDEIWRKEPDLRLGQLILNAARLGSGPDVDVGGIEDGLMRKGLERYLKTLQNSGTL